MAASIQGLRHVFDEILHGLAACAHANEAFGDCVSAPAGAALG
jgi:hypothetical protein